MNGSINEVVSEKEMEISHNCKTAFNQGLAIYSLARTTWDKVSKTVAALRYDQTTFPHIYSTQIT